MTFPYAVGATLSGGCSSCGTTLTSGLFENGTTGGIRVYDLATGAELPVPETALDCIVVDEGGQRLVFNCYDLPEGLTYAYDDPDQPLHQYVLVTDREGNVLMREDGCTASSLASYRGGFADWLDLSWFRGSDWGIAREALYNVTTGELLTGEEDSAVSACGVGRRLPPEPSGQLLYPLRFERRRGRGAGPLRPGREHLHPRLRRPLRQR